MTLSSIAASFLLGFLILEPLVADEKLTAEQSRFVENLRASALQYTKELPNFLCTQTTHRTVRDISSFPTGMTGISTGGRAAVGVSGEISQGGDDTIDEQLTFFDHSEHYEVISVNGKKVSGLKHLELEGAVSAGEFGSAMENLFDPRAKTIFAWNRDTTISGRRVHVLGFRVPKEYGNLVIYRRGGQQTMAPYSGRIFVDPANFQLVKIVSELDLPVGFPIKMESLTVEYRPVEIAGTSFNLPYKSEVRLEDDSHLYVNTIEFRNYHKFSVQSTIHYDGISQPQ